MKSHLSGSWLRGCLAACFTLALLLVGSSAWAQMKVAVVDVQRAVMQTEDGLRAQATLKKLFDNRQQELNHKQDDLAKQRDDIKKQEKVLSQQALQKKIDDWQKQMVELQTTFEEYNRELMKKQKELTDPIVERVMSTIKRLAGQDSYDLIVDKATVAFVRTDLDLTDRVIQMVNSGGAGGSSGPKAPPPAGGPAPVPLPGPGPLAPPGGGGAAPKPR
jgi:outer membrane protein